ncbi:MAG: glycoside hydrolase family 95 protein [Treponema sp.]|nr:glycoside hydrolase family 95 protein [Treponema sp.]
MDIISYKEAAKDFASAFPIGNGRLGATVYGGIGSQIIALNEESLWSSPFIDRVNRSSRKDFPRIKSMYAEGKDTEAAELVKESFAPLISSPAHYKGAGNFRIDFFSSADRQPLAEKEDSILTYERKLDMETGIASESFSLESPKDSTAIFSSNAPLGGGSSVSYSREVFVSAANDVIAIHIGASLPRNIYLRAGFESDGETRTVFALDDDTIALERMDGIPMCAMAMASTTGGSCRVKGGFLIVEAADDVTIYVDIETAYRSGHYRRSGGDVSRSAKSLATSAADKALKKLCFAQTKPYQSVLDDHASLFSRRYRRFSITLSDKQAEADWKFYRYKLLSSFSQPGTLPVLESGLWLDGKQGQADCGVYNMEALYTLPYLKYGLEKSYSSMSRYLKALRKRSFRCAKAMFQDDGSISYGAGDIWGDSAPSSCDKDFFAPMGAVYAALSVKNYYDYSLDTKFLKKHFRLLTGPCEFFIGFKPPRDWTEKENVLLRRLFEATWEAAAVLGKSNKYPEIHSFLAGLSNIDDRLMEENEGQQSPVDSIIRGRMSKGKLMVELLRGGASGSGKMSGELKGLHLPGNLRADILWENGSPKGGRIYAKPNSSQYIKAFVLLYGGKSYPAEVQTGSIDILNILPSTV